MRENRPYGLAGGETELNRSSLPRSKNRLFELENTAIAIKSAVSDA